MDEILTNDNDAYQAYPMHRHWMNKLWLAEHMGYRCGPAGLPTPAAGRYIVRPVQNLRGMALGARILDLPAGWTGGDPGYFWCEAFEGDKLSLDLVPDGPGWKCVRALKAEGGNLGVPERWSEVRLHPQIRYVKQLDKLMALQHHEIPVNIETVGGRIVEVHLRHNPDPAGKFLFPVTGLELHNPDPWAVWVDAYEDCDGYLTTPRLGFWVIR